MKDGLRSQLLTKAKAGDAQQLWHEHLRIQYPGAYYHVTCRGNDRRVIYTDDHDRKLFKEKLKQSMEIYDVVLHGYVLMNNHFHLLLQTPQGNLSEFMRHFNISYT